VSRAAHCVVALITLEHVMPRSIGASSGKPWLGASRAVNDASPTVNELLAGLDAEFVSIHSAIGQAFARLAPAQQHGGAMDDPLAAMSV